MSITNRTITVNVKMPNIMPMPIGNFAIGERVRLNTDYLVRTNFHTDAIILHQGSVGIVISNMLSFGVWLVSIGNSNFAVEGYALDTIEEYTSKLSKDISKCIEECIEECTEEGILPVSVVPERDQSIHKIGQGFVSNEKIWAAVKAFGDGSY